MRFLHLLPIVGHSAPQELLTAQDLTLQSIEIARDFSTSIVVDVVGSRFFDEEIPVDCVIDYPCLTTSFSDICGFEEGPRLPLLREVFLPLQDFAGYDYIIFSNIDIGFQPFFYDLVKQWTSSGLDAINITRRNINARIENASLVKMWSAEGVDHSGSDCFVFTPKMAEKFVFGDVAMGLPPVGIVLTLNLLLQAKFYRKFFKQHATFHVGLDSDWKSNSLKFLLRNHNAEKGFQVRSELTHRYGFGNRDMLRQPPLEVFKAAHLLGYGENEFLST